MHEFYLKASVGCRTFMTVRAHGMWTYEPRQGRKAATVVCSTSAVVTLAFFNDEGRMKNAESIACRSQKNLVSSFCILHSSLR